MSIAISPATPQSSPEHAATIESDEVATSRRALLGVGLSNALGIGASAVLAALAGEALTNAAPAIAAEPTPSATATPSAAPTSSASPAPPAPRAIAKKPFAHGGPTGRDQSMANAVPTGATTLSVGAQYPTFSAAARAAQPLASSLFDGTDAHAHLLRRATFGARPYDVSDLKKRGIDGWLKRQLAPSTIDDPSGAAAWAAFPLAGATPSTINRTTAKYSWDAMFETGQATLGRQLFSRRQLYEIVVDIFANHLHVAIPSEQWNTSPGYAKNVIRKYAFGKYRDMLRAAMKHPAMLNFLNNDESYKEHVNENLGRELLELHTVGVASGYTEDDVKASARILSGRTIDYDRGAYRYDRYRHATGPVAVLEFRSANATESGGEAVGDAYLAYLATHPSTARNVARKIAVRFISDQPSSELVQRLADVYLANDTSILAVVRAVFLSSDFWSAVGVRMRRPLEDTVGAARVLNVSMGSTAKNTKKGITNMYWGLWEAGQPPLGWNPPNGYPDVAAAWLGAGSMIQRWNVHRAATYGWWGGLKYTTPLKIVTIHAGDTAEQWVQALARRLLGTELSPEHLAAVIAGGELSAGKPPTYNWWAGKTVSLLLDSAYFQLR
ncbi:MAG: hypothetical protein JWQ12_755 [Glaciihabitans sp.]|nr:hypothetical protein [Glaciihabitans sp.]